MWGYSTFCACRCVCARQKRKPGKKHFYGFAVFWQTARLAIRRLSISTVRQLSKSIRRKWSTAQRAQLTPPPPTHTHPTPLGPSPLNIYIKYMYYKYMFVCRLLAHFAECNPLWQWGMSYRVLCSLCRVSNKVQL